MSGVKEFATAIIIVSFIIASIDILMPSGAYKKYIKLSLGVLLILVIMNPIARLINKNFYINDIDIANGSQKATNSQDYKNLYNAKVIEAFKQGLCDKLLTELSKNKIEVSKIVFEVDENENSEKYLTPTYVTITASSNINTSKVSQIIGNQFGITQNKIRFQK